MILQILQRLFHVLLGLCRQAYHLAQNHIEARHGQPVIGGEEEGRLAQKSSWHRLAIVVLHPEQHSAPFIVNLLNGLAENNFFVLAVAAKKLPLEIKDSVLSHCHYLLERFSINRNYASVKAALEWAEKQTDLKDADTLTLLDDGFYYPRHISSTLGQMLGQDADWLNLFDNSQTSGPSQSFFHIFRAAVFKSDAFAEFWKNEALAPIQLHAAKGETGLGAALNKAGFIARAYYSSTRLRADILAALENENVPVRLQDTLNLTLGFERRKKGRVPPRAQDSLSLPTADVARRIGKLAEGDNPAHAIGLLCNYLYQAPLKRSIGHYANTASDLIALVQGFSTGEKTLMTEELGRKNKNRTTSLVGIRKIPQRLLQTARGS